MTAPTRHNVLILASSDVLGDGRVLLGGATLVKNGYTVRVIGLGIRGGLPQHTKVDDMDIWIAPWVNYRNPILWLREIGRWFRGDTSSVTEPGAAFRKGIFLLSAIFANLWVLRLGIKGKADVIHCHEHRLILVCLLLKYWHRARLIYDAHESVPDNLLGLKRWLGSNLETLILRRADAVITVGERLARSLRERGGRHVVVVGNWKRLEDFDIDAERIEVERQKLNLDHYKLVVSYIGALSPARLIDPLLKAIAETPDVALLIGGRGILEDQITAAAQENINIYWLEWIEFSQLPLYSHLSDVIYYCFDPNLRKQASYVVPNKLFEAFAAGKALIVHPDKSEMAEILERYSAGIMLDEVTPTSIKSAFESLKQGNLLESLQAHARSGREEYNWSVAEERLAALYIQLVGPPPIKDHD